MNRHSIAVAAFLVAVCAAFGLAASSVLAQSVQPVVAQSSSPATAPTPSFSDAELKVFADAVLDVQHVTDTFLPKLKAATTIEDQQKVEEAASAEMARVVE